MRSRQIIVALLLVLHLGAAVVNNGQSVKTEEEKKSEKDKPQDSGDLVAESSETNRREAPASLDSYGVPPISSSLPIPVYGVPNAPSNNVIYPAPPPDIPPPPPKVPISLYGVPSFGKTYGVPQPYKPPIKYGVPAFSYNQFNLSPKPPKNIYGPPAKPFKFYNKFPSKNFGFRPPKPVYGPPVGLKDNFNFNKLSSFHSSTSNNLYSGVSTLNHQYGAPILPPQIQYTSTNVAYGPPQPSPNPKPPHPGIPAPPTPPDIKYDGWQPIPGLVSKRPVEEAQHHLSGLGYQDLTPPPKDIYGAPPVTLEISHGNSLLDQSGVSDSYGVPLNSVTGSKGVSDSYSAPLGSVTGSGGVVASSGEEAGGGGSHSITLDLGSIGIGHGSDLHAVKSIEYNLGPQVSSYKGYTASSIGLVPPASKPGLYTSVNTNAYLPPSGSYGPPSHGAAVSYQNFAQGSSTAGIDLQHSTFIEGASALPLTSYTAPSGAIDGSYTLPKSNDDLTVSLDYSHPPVSIDLTGGKAQDCYNKQPPPTLVYGVPSPESYTSSLASLTTNIGSSHLQSIPQPVYSSPSSQYGVPDLLHSASVKNEAKSNSLEDNEESHGKNYGKSVAESFGPNSELVESQSLDLNNIALQGKLGNYSLQIQSADGGAAQVPHNQVLSEGLLQSILQAIEQPGKQGQKSEYPIIIQPSQERDNYSFSQDSNQDASEIKEVVVEAPKNNEKPADGEESLQLLDTSNIALYFKNDEERTKAPAEEKSEENAVDS